MVKDVRFVAAEGGTAILLFAEEFTRAKAKVKYREKDVAREKGLIFEGSK